MGNSGGTTNSTTIFVVDDNKGMQRALKNTVHFQPDELQWRLSSSQFKVAIVGCWPMLCKQAMAGLLSILSREPLGTQFAVRNFQGAIGRTRSAGGN
jgi:hypothetical protein